MAEPSAIAASVASAERLRAGLWRENPVLVQALGMCPTLAVSNTATNALTMGLATAAVLLASAVVISAIRGLIPPQVRLACFVLVIATFVTVASLLLEAFAPALHGNLGAFLSLIVVNCIILGRIEAVASRQPVHVAAADALGMGGGFVLGLVALGSLRELLGQGALFGQRLLPEAFEPWQVLQLPAGGFFALAALVLGFRAVDRRRRAREVPT
jgi:electron transport complex protein RnfE